ncbi:hypothetical protein Anas_04126, partial [Armadillidium nasatum]
VKQEVDDIQDFIDENTEKVSSYFVTDGLTFEKEFKPFEEDGNKPSK